MLLWVLGGQQLIAEEYMGEIQCTLVGCLEMIPRDRSAVGEKPEGNLRCWYLSCHTQGSFYFLPIFFMFCSSQDRASLYILRQCNVGLISVLVNVLPKHACRPHRV